MQGKINYLNKPDSYGLRAAGGNSGAYFILKVKQDLYARQ